MQETMSAAMLKPSWLAALDEDSSTSEPPSCDYSAAYEAHLFSADEHSEAAATKQCVSSVSRRPTHAT